MIWDLLAFQIVQKSACCECTLYHAHYLCVLWVYVVSCTLSLLIHCKEMPSAGLQWPILSSGIAQWLERRTRDWKVAGSNPCRSGGRFFFSMVDFLCWLLFRYPFHPRVTAVARKRSRSFCQSAGSRLQLNTHIPYVCGFAWSDMVHGCMVYTELAPRRLQFHVAPAMPAL